MLFQILFTQYQTLRLSNAILVKYFLLPLDKISNVERLKKNHLIYLSTDSHSPVSSHALALFRSISVGDFICTNRPGSTRFDSVSRGDPQDALLETGKCRSLKNRSVIMGPPGRMDLMNLFINICKYTSNPTGPRPILVSRLIIVPNPV